EQGTLTVRLSSRPKPRPSPKGEGVHGNLLAFGLSWFFICGIFGRFAVSAEHLAERHADLLVARFEHEYPWLDGDNFALELTNLDGISRFNAEYFTGRLHVNPCLLAVAIADAGGESGKLGIIEFRWRGRTGLVRVCLARRLW